MNAGKMLFSQLMDCLPWSTFARIVARYHGDHSVQTFPCTEQYLAMAFAQLTYRESLRDIEACLSAQPAKLWHLGFGRPVRRSTLADANEVRDWRIYAEFAQRLIAQARRLYIGESLMWTAPRVNGQLQHPQRDAVTSVHALPHSARHSNRRTGISRSIPAYVDGPPYQRPIAAPPA